MIVQAGVVDSGFRGEIFVAINNASYKTLYISNNDKAVLEHDRQYYTNKNITDEEISKDIIIYPTNKGICQAKLELVPGVEVKETTYEELLQIHSERGTGMLGDSGK